MKKYILYLLILSVFNSCNEEKEKVIDNEESIPQMAVVITKNPEIKSKISFANGVSMPEISYLEFSTLPDSISRFGMNNTKIDTFRINIEKSFIEVAHRYNTLHLVKYYLKPGDTLLIEYNDSVPKAILTNRKTLKYDLNYDVQMNEILFSSQIIPDFKAAFPLPFMDRSQDLREESERVKNLAIIEFNNGILKESIVLDSLIQHKLISSENYQHRIVNQYYSALTFNLKYGVSNEDLRYVQELQKFELTSDKEMNYDEIVLESSDSLLKYNSFVDFVEEYLEQKYKQKLPMIRSKNGFFKDYRLFFDYINNDSILTHEKKEYFLYKNMVQIVENFTVDDREIYLKKYEAFGPQNALLTKIKSDFNFEGKTKDLEVNDVNGEITTLEKVKNQNKGKLIYIDFWASWCKPCIELMPDSHHLRDSLADLEIEFLYFSIDEDEKKWKHTSEKHSIKLNNYLVINRYSSVFLEEIGLDAIPRYLLYDKNGNLIQENAPDPSSAELRKTIFKYLNEP